MRLLLRVALRAAVVSVIALPGTAAEEAPKRGGTLT
jgi:hypothetical protein